MRGDTQLTMDNQDSHNQHLQRGHMHDGMPGHSRATLVLTQGWLFKSIDKFYSKTIFVPRLSHRTSSSFSCACICHRPRRHLPTRSAHNITRSMTLACTIQGCHQYIMHATSNLVCTYVPLAVALCSTTMGFGTLGRTRERGVTGHREVIAGGVVMGLNQRCRVHPLYTE